MTARATFTQGELERAIRAAQKTGMMARVIQTDDGPMIEFVPDQVITMEARPLTPPPGDPQDDVARQRKGPGEW